MPPANRLAHKDLGAAIALAGTLGVDVPVARLTEDYAGPGLRHARRSAGRSTAGPLTAAARAVGRPAGDTLEGPRHEKRRAHGRRQRATPAGTRGHTMSAAAEPGQPGTGHGQDGGGLRLQGRSRRRAGRLRGHTPSTTSSATVWTRPGLDLRERRLLTIGMLAALGKSELLESSSPSALEQRRARRRPGPRGRHPPHPLRGLAALATTLDGAAERVDRRGRAPGLGGRARRTGDPRLQRQGGGGDRRRRWHRPGLRRGPGPRRGGGGGGRHRRGGRRARRPGHRRRRRAGRGLPVDVADPASAAAMAERALAEPSAGIDFLVNNAAIFGGMKLDLLLSVDWDYLQRFLAVNLLGALVCTRACYPSMAEPGAAGPSSTSPPRRPTSTPASTAGPRRA